MSRTSWIVTFIVLGVAALGVLLFFSQFERKLVPYTWPPYGVARDNRFFALERTLARLDVPVTSLATIAPEDMPLHSGDTLVLGDGLERIEADDAARIAAWVRSGGNLVLETGNASDAAHTPLLQALGLLSASKDAHADTDADADADADTGVNTDSACVLLRADEASHAAANSRFDLCGQRFWLAASAASHAVAAIGDGKQGYLFARVQAGRGVVSLLASMDVMSGRSLRQAPAQAFTWRVLAPLRKGGHVYLVYALDGVSFWKALFARGWPVWLASILLLSGWVAARSQRLGPVMPAPLPQRRALLEHVQASGVFLFRRDAGVSLHRLACRYLLAWLQRRDPLLATLQGDALHQHLAERHQLDPVQVARAFQPPASAAAFRDSIVCLAQLRSHP
jgi:hypothetical protein